VFHQVFVDREYDHWSLPSDARLIVDAGANVGMAALFFADRYPGATILAVEPEQGNFDTLCANVQGFSQIKPIRSALWPSSGHVEIANPADDAWAFQVKESIGGSIPAITVPEIIAAQRRRIDVFKIDIEGAEKELFQSGADRWLAEVDLIVLETHDRFKPGCTEAVSNALSGYPHRRFKLGENDFYLFGHRPQTPIEPSVVENSR
jgi:FkbM family methyltransferase